MAKQEAPKNHPWMDAAIEWGKRNGSFCSIEYGSPEYEAWGNYFIAIGYVPALFAAMNSRGQTWTAPTRWADTFDMPIPDFKRREVYWRRNPALVSVGQPLLRPTETELDALFAKHGLSHLRPESKLKSQPRPLSGKPPGHYAKLFVGHDKPGYQAMVERSKSADPADWCWYRDHPEWGHGIKVPITWYWDFRGARRPSTGNIQADAQAILDRYAAEAQQGTEKEAAE